MGGGFGGCTINLVQKNRVDEFIDTLTKAYRKDIHRDMQAYVVALKDGTSVIPHPIDKEPSLL
jgi:galactokinase